MLFGIYGAVLQFSGAGTFFLDWAMAAMGRSGSGAGPGRTVTIAGFLLGNVSGSGVATTVTLGSVAWPLLKGAGYSPEVAGAILSAGGIGAILSPPTLGAAAFLIAEFLQISYLQVLDHGHIPTLLYYLSILLMIEADSRRLGTTPDPNRHVSLAQLTWRYGYHFTSLVAIALFMGFGMTAFRAVFWATVLAFALSFVRKETAMHPRKLGQALEDGGLSILPVIATTATAGIIVGVVTLTGLGLKIAGILVTLAGSSLFLTVLYSAIAVWLLGLAVPVTASYIIAAVMVAPALTQVGVHPAAAHMFIFYYAVFSEVSPPTALSPFAAAAITGANPFRTMMLTWKYTIPAFLVPFAFTLAPEGMGLLMKAPLATILWTSLTAASGVAALAFGAGGWLKRRATVLERVLAVGGLLLIYPRPIFDVAGIGLLVLAVVMHVGDRKTKRKYQDNLRDLNIDSSGFPLRWAFRGFEREARLRAGLQNLTRLREREVGHINGIGVLFPDDIAGLVFESQRKLDDGESLRSEIGQRSLDQWITLVGLWLGVIRSVQLTDDEQGPVIPRDGIKARTRTSLQQD